jgi:hypothetical protein
MFGYVMLLFSHRQLTIPLARAVGIPMQAAMTAAPKRALADDTMAVLPLHTARGGFVVDISRATKPVAILKKSRLSEILLASTRSMGYSSRKI